jgi:hypothetical protein
MAVALRRLQRERSDSERRNIERQPRRSAVYDDRNSIAGVMDKQPLAGLVLLPHRRRQLDLSHDRART